VPTQVVEPGRTSDMSYDAAGRLTQRMVTDTTAHTIPYATKGETRTWTYTYTAEGLLATVDGPRSDVTDVTTYTYDLLGNLTKVTNALG
jgi:YD repeat-containing protein